MFCLGIAPADGIFKGKAEGVGNPVFYVGASTGRDGIHGATMASAEFDEASAEKRPTVQVGDPFMEKLLLEACLEVLETGALVGVQDMGAAGLTCATSEMARAGTGIDIEVATVPQRETGMTPYEIMLSESQERMLLVATRGARREVERIFEKWDLHAVCIGRVTDDGRCACASTARSWPRCRHGRSPTRRRSTTGRRSDPTGSTTSSSWSRRTSRRSRRRPRADDAARLADDRQQEVDLPAVRPHGAHQHAVPRGPGTPVVRVKGTNRALAMSVDGNGRYGQTDPKRGAMLAVAEAARNVALAGGVPIGATNCLNFGNPEKPEIMWQFVEAVAGIGEACRAFGMPITGGNVSLYNETDGKAIYPTPVIGMVGLIEDASTVVGQAFPSDGLKIVLLGETRAELGGTEYLQRIHGEVRGLPPALDLAHERALHALLPQLIGAGSAGLGARLRGGRPRGRARRVRVRRRAGRRDRRGARRDRAGGRARRARDAVQRVGRAGDPGGRAAALAAVLERAAAAGVVATVIGTTGGDALTVNVDGEAALDDGRGRTAGGVGTRARGRAGVAGARMKGVPRRG